MSINPTYQQRLANIPEDNRNQYIQTLSKCLRDHSCPMTIRKVLEAQHSHEGVTLGRPDGRSIKIKLLAAGSVGAVFTLATRIIRVAVSSFGLIVSPMYFYAKGARYGIVGECQDNFKRVGEEWVDLEATIEAFGIGWANVFFTGTGSERMKSWKDYYIQRIDQRNTRDEFVQKKIKEYNVKQSAIKEAWKGGNPPPVQSDSHHN